MQEIEHCKVIYNGRMIDVSTCTIAQLIKIDVSAGDD
jgi:hypothetical protein